MNRLCLCTEVSNDINLCRLPKLTKHTDSLCVSWFFNAIVMDRGFWKIKFAAHFRLPVGHIRYLHCPASNNSRQKKIVPRTTFICFTEKKNSPNTRTTTAIREETIRHFIYSHTWVVCVDIVSCASIRFRARNTHANERQFFASSFFIKMTFRFFLCSSMSKFRSARYHSLHRYNWRGKYYANACNWSSYYGRTMSNVASHIFSMTVGRIDL